MNFHVDFSSISRKYEGVASVQQSAGEILLSMLEIGKDEDVLDVG